MASWKALTLFALILTIAGAPGCDCGSSTTGAQNLPPEASAGEDSFVLPGGSGALAGSGFDLDGDSLTYAWTQTAGASVTLSDAAAAAPTFTAPDDPQTLTFQLVVSDGQASSTPDTVDIVVNTPPRANAGDNQTVFTGAAVSLDGSASSDGDEGDTLTYSWVQVDTGGALVILDDATSAAPGFTAPDEVQALTFRLTVSDGKQDSEPDLVTVQVEAEPVNTPPVADAGLNQEVYTGEEVILAGTGSDADGDALTYNWHQVSGETVTLDSVNSNVATFTAPDTPGLLVFELVVNDGAQNSEPDAVQVRVLDPFNASPVANAGPDQEVAVDTLVTLDGSASDADGDPLTYRWTQVTGDAVVLSDDTDPAASFTAPATVQTLVFELVASDGLGSSDPDRVTIVVSDVVTNGPPVASAGDDQVAEVNSPVILAGSGWDPDGDTMTYRWTQVGGDEVVLADPTAASTTFTAPGQPGLLVFQLEVSDGALTSAPDTVAVEVRDSSLNTPPVADAGLDATVEVGAAVTLYGSGSDADGDPLTYRWVQTAGDDVTLDDDTAASPSFTAPATAQTLTFELTANDGTTDSDPDEVVITVETTVVNQLPVADAGMDQEVVVSTEVTLDASASSDPDGDPLTYLWTQVEGDPVTLSDPAAVQPTFTAPAAAGTLEFQLGVHDGTAWSAADSVTITVVESSDNTPPVADAGLDRQAAFGEAVALDGTGSSDADGDELTYAWLQLSGEPVALDDPASPTPGFTAPAVGGVLTFQLVVNDGAVSSAPDTVDVEVLDPTNQKPVANAGPDQEVEVGTEVTLAGSGSDADSDPLSYEWTQTQGDAVTLSDDTDPAASFTAPVTAQTLVFELVANDGSIDSDADSVTIVVSETVTNTAPTADAGEDQTVNPGDTVTLAGSGSDAEGDPLSYLWSQTAGDAVVLSDDTDPAASFTAPAKPQTLTFELTSHDGSLGSAPDSVNIVVENRAPTADAGEDQTVAKKILVSLDGAASSDPDGHALGFAWTFTAVPAGSALTDADIADADTALPSFTPDISGDFMLELTVDDGYGGSDTDQVMVSASNGDPVAEAGEDQTVAKRVQATLDGSGSSDPDGDTITYAWVFDFVPASSALTDGDINGADTAAPYFVPDVAGTYAVQLTVTDEESAAAMDTVAVIATNDSPVADAGEDQSVTKKTLVTLDGSGSSDPNGDAITYAWTFDSVPAASALTDGDITDADTPAPGFTPDVSGEFVLRLTVTDVELLSGSDTVSVTAANQDPTADAGEDAVATKKEPVTLDGSGSSDPDGDSLTYAWAFQSVPDTSTLTDGDIADAATAAPSFTPDVSGAFVLELTVDDGDGGTDSDTVQITATNTAPTADAGPDQPAVLKNTLVNLDGSGSSDPNGDAITYAWNFDSVPAGSALGDGDITDADTAAPSFTPDVSGDFVLELTVDDGDGGADTDMVTITATNQDPTADAGEDDSVQNLQEICLDGSGSSDPDGDALAYAWTFDTLPAGSALGDGDISGADTAAPCFTPDAVGDFILQLTVDDGDGGTDTDTVTVTSLNNDPTADAGEDQRVLRGGLVQLDGSGSSDPDGHALTYDWQQTAGEAVTLDPDGTVVDPSFNAPATPQTLTFEMTVDDGHSGTGMDSVDVVVNSPPVPDPGEDQKVKPREHVTLAGSATDDDGDPLTYEWIQVGGAPVTLSDETDPAAEFDAPDFNTTLIFYLRAHDGYEYEEVDPTNTVTIEVQNARPVADVGPDQEIGAGQLVTLDGTGSYDDDGDPISYQWSVVGGPPVVLSDDTDPQPTFLAGSPGDVHVLSLVVDDGTWPSLPDLVTISVQPLGPAVYVDQNDPDGNDDPALCGTRDQPCLSIGVGYQVATNQDPMLDVWVALGTYNENLVIDQPVSLFGGYATQDFDTRDWATNVTAIVSDALQTDGVRFEGGVTSALNGFYVLAQGVDDCGVPTQAALTVLDASPTITDNWIGFVEGILGAATTYGVRVVGTTTQPAPYLAGNTITGGPGCAMVAAESVGLDPGIGLPAIVGNLIDGGQAHNSTGMRITRSFDPGFQLEANTLQGGGRAGLTMRSVGLFLGDQPDGQPVSDWTVSGNTFRGGVGTNLAVGLWAYGDRNRVEGCTFDGQGGPDGTLSTSSVGVRLRGLSADPADGNALEGCTCRGGRGQNAVAAEVSGVGAEVTSNTILAGGRGDDDAQSSTGLSTGGTSLEVAGNQISGGIVTRSGGGTGLLCLACTGAIHDNWISGSGTAEAANPSVGLSIQTGDIMPVPDEPEVFANAIVGGLGDDRNTVTGMRVSGLGADPYVHDNTISGAEGAGAQVSRALEVASSASGEYALNDILGQEAEQVTQGAVFSNAGAAWLHDCFVSGGYLTKGQSTGIQLDVSNGVQIADSTINGGLTESSMTRGVAVNGGAGNRIERNTIWAGESAWLGAGAFTAGIGVDVQGRAMGLAGPAAHIYNNYIGGGDHPWTYGVQFNNGTSNLNGNVIYGGEASGGWGLESVGIEYQGANAIGPIGTARNNIVHAGLSPGSRFHVRVRAMTIVAAIDNNDLMPVEGGVTALLREEGFGPPVDYLDIGGVNGLGYAADNIDGDPLFVDPVGGDLHLSDGSPCIDRGTFKDDGGTNPPPKEDFDHGVRPFADEYDIGLDEWGAP